MKMKSYFIETILLVIIVSPSVAIVTPPPPGPPLYVFGDSLVDAGNNNHLQDPAPKANHPFHGVDYPGNVSTGRFCNGYIGSDYVAMCLGYPQSPPAYLSITNEFQTLGGINFASAGSGILNSTGEGTLSLATQVMYFEGAASNLSRRVGNMAPNTLLSKSIFYISSGSNDIFAYFFGSKNQTNNQFIATMVNNFRLHLTKLYNCGARKIIMLSTSNIGCIPFIRSLFPLSSGDCSEELNNLSIQFKNETRDLLQNLTSTMPELRYTFIDTYEIDSELRENAHQYGFTDLTNACCGHWKV
ncbi:GDSL esterase/lipase At1g71691-like [Dioscorea cayenensis subsp. rotundata]|uniref:GDSL esterase/lipase At1g71691-like n=1 Tax=Dioscorea cayennensis subsp. rotundata TaxID=55577 RepID=A0AB40CVM4_DIOCR|nr:GDSL esterase/lipase At1g71691-like [Dioscorea cayenensis subsp. rotundata]